VLRLKWFAGLQERLRELVYPGGNPMTDVRGVILAQIADSAIFSCQLYELSVIGIYVKGPFNR
jgi:hypothetical protein